MGDQALRSDDNTSLIRRGYEAYANRDFAAIFALLHPDIEIIQTDLLPWGGLYHGHDEAREFFRKLNEHTDAQPEPRTYLPAGDDVAVIGRLKGRARATGRQFDLAIVHLWTIKADKIARFAAYIDTPRMLEALNRKGAT